MTNAQQGLYAVWDSGAQEDEEGLVCEWRRLMPIEEFKALAVRLGP